MNARTNARKWSGSAFVVLVCLMAVLLAIASPAVAVKRGTESVNCGGAASQSASYRAHETPSPSAPSGPSAKAAVASGVYFARLQVDGRSDDQKVMVLRQSAHSVSR